LYILADFFLGEEAVEQRAACLVSLGAGELTNSVTEPIEIRLIHNP